MLYILNRNKYLETVLLYIDEYIDYYHNKRIQSRITNIVEDDTSFCGCLNQCLRYLQENTKAQIVLIIMIGANDSPPETETETRNITQFEFAQKIELVTKLNSVPVINVFCESGFGYARVKSKEYQLDSIHLNKLGGLNMGNFVWSKLKDIPLWETEL